MGKLRNVVLGEEENEQNHQLSALNGHRFEKNFKRLENSKVR